MQELKNSRTAIERVLEIPAKNESVPGTQQLDVEATAFYLIDCTGEVEIRTDENSFKTYRKSTGEEFPQEQTFQRLEFRNQGSSPVSVRVWAGWGRYIDRRFEMVEAVTKARGFSEWPGGAQEVPANSSIDLPAQLGGGVISRKSVLITNLDPNEKLRLEDADNNTFLTIFPNTSVTLPISDTFSIHNDTGEAVSVNIGEIVYVEGNLITTAS
ncbi:hypothetical protein DDZ13_06595 [Coraliomargarita sinensis]|uniref:Uncharacterized protein n=1 Tax=Coraliomargarita sinensis TaxID=2174842 RepID=A0A317ZLL3_9BACT|nr:hypothetical protein [Coraliomargarita sinensis]PXA04828.1 hypothetical protein DDZ13_06595 [Coraliomargarita sinensis]